MSGNGDLAIRSSQWKYIPDLGIADGWYAGKKRTPTPPEVVVTTDPCSPMITGAEGGPLMPTASWC